MIGTLAAIIILGLVASFSVPALILTMASVGLFPPVSVEALGRTWTFAPRNERSSSDVGVGKSKSGVKLDYHIIKSMVNSYFGLYVDRARRPTFFNIKESYPGLDLVTQAFPAIRAEFDRVQAQSRDLPQYHEIDSGERKISSTTPKRWNVFMLEIMGHKPAANRALCPDTCRVLARVPNMIQAFFSILEPGKSVPEHEGPYLGYLRYHLGLRVPTDNPPKLIVNRQDYVWKEGEAVLFDDSWPHSVVNNASETRAVLIVDVRRPLPTAPDLVNRFFIDVIGRHTYGRHLARKAEEFAAGKSAAAPQAAG